MPRIEITNGLYFVECIIALTIGMLLGLVMWFITPQVIKAVKYLIGTFKRIFRK